MADEQQVTLLCRSIREWNRWRVENPQVTPDLAGAGLRGVNLSGANLAEANLKGADLRGAVLSGCMLIGAELTAARNWRTAYRDEHLECGAPIPERGDRRETSCLTARRSSLSR
jgi:hypothetical protein